MTNPSRGFNIVAARNRQQYLKLLRESAREAVSNEKVFSDVKSAAISTSCKIRMHEANLNLPENWVKNSTERLQKSLEGIVLPNKILNNDLFLSALIHPSHVRVRSTRSIVAMPIELTLTGSSTLRLLKEIASVHGMTGILHVEETSDIPRRLNVEEFLLYDKSIFSGEGESDSSRPPEEVRLAAATALCGALTLTESFHSTSLLLDRLRQKYQQQ
ncbi:uncharacterized protein TM35_000016660 [Trypanosoma theileri]|uniref:Uncharacterized protein n=1 Tax=Trypanosoma theileri TaxID=67003 RepID=A0A1X0PB36_9TRYP|nr:uncharacterized protein TM35_000016660 [Trypanosoma theileri]ORC93789.1 hypothetical protein TM35_000016660 [Trypanosoma theileri]